MANLNQHQLPFQRVQAVLAEHIRNPETNPPPSDVEDRRLQIYRRLFYNTIESFCSRNLRSLRNIVDDEYWHTLIREFMHSYRCDSPYFREIPQQFMHFLVETHKEKDRLPYITELCHFDAIRLELRLAPDTTYATESDSIDFQTDKLVLSDLVRLLSYQWPVHEIDADYIEIQPPTEPTWIVAFRNKQDNVQILVSNARTIRLLELLRTPQEGAHLLTTLAQELHLSPEKIHDQTIDAVRSFVKRGVLIVLPD